MIQSNSLRGAAEAALTRNSTIKPMPHADGALLHELQVHQIELEMQNESLRQSQAELEESRDRYLDLYDFAPLGYLTLNDMGRISMINFTGAKLLGVVRNKLMLQRFAYYVAPEDRDRWHILFTKTLQGENTHNFGLSLQQAGNKKFYAQLNCVRQEQEGMPPVVRITLTDVTRLRLAETAMHEWHTFIECAAWGMAIGDVMNRVIRLANPAYAQMHGYTVEELCNIQTDVLYAPESLSDLHLFVQSLRYNKRSSFECVRRRKDGSKFPAMVDAILVEHPNGVNTAMISVKDISAQKVLEMELKTSHQMLRQLAEKVEATREEERKHIARELHDELGQILTALRMDVALISLRFGELDAALLKKTQHMSELLNKAGHALHEIISDLRPTALDMGIIAGIRWLCNDFSSRTGNACVLHTTEEQIKLDEEREVSLFRIVQELLTNAARHAEADRVDITLTRSAEGIQLAVSDNGRGFDTATVANKSFGLLGIQERVIALGGLVKIVSVQNCGTLIKLILPTQRKENAR